MIGTIVVTTIQIVSFIMTSVAFLFSIKIHQQFKSLTSIRLIFIASFLMIWSSVSLISSMLLIFTKSSNILEPKIKVLAIIGLCSLFTAFAIVAYVQVNPIYTRKVRLTGVLALIAFTILTGYTLSDLIESHDFLSFKAMNGIWLTQFDGFYTGFIFLGIIFFVLSFYYSSQFLDNFPEDLLTGQIFHFTKRSILIISSVVFTCFLVFILAPINLAGIFALLLEILISLLVLIYFYLQYQQPFLQLGFGANPMKLLEHNLVGYFIGSSLDQGPTIIKKSELFFDRTKIDKNTLDGLNIGVITLVGINDSFREQVAIVPVPKFDDYTAIAISFFMKNPQVQDERVKDKAPTVLGIIVPSLLALSLRGINEIRSKVDDIFIDLDHIEKLSEEGLKTSVAKILHELLY